MRKILKWIVLSCMCLIVLGYTQKTVHASVVTPQEGTENEGSEDAEEETEEIPEIKVLMIGNSFTKRGNSQYNVGNILEEIAQANNKKVSVDTIVYGGSYLHYYAFWSYERKEYFEEMLSALMTKQYDYIILQDQTKVAVEKYENMMLTGVRQLCMYIQAYQKNAKVLLYETAVYEDGTYTIVDGKKCMLGFQEFQERSLLGYARLRKTLSLESVPVGAQTYYSMQCYPEINMISEDKRHPSYAGYYLAATSFYYKIYGEKPIVTKEQLTKCEIDNEQISMLNELVSDKIVLDKTDITLKVNASEVLVANIQVDKTGEGILYWKSLNPEIATVNEETGEVTGITQGTTIIIAETTTGLMKECLVTVENTSLPKLSFGQKNYQVKEGDVFQLLPQVKNWQRDDTWKWSSSNSSVAAVSTDGIVTAKRMGKVVIKVKSQKDDTISASYNLYVVGKKPENLKVEIKENKVGGEEVKLSWERVCGAEKYQIYRYEKNLGYTVIGTSETNAFTDTMVEVNTRYKYKVTAMATSILTESVASEEVSAFLLGTVENQISSITKNYIKISWNQNNSATGYEIYRSEKKNSGYKKIKTISKKERTYYVDKTVEKGTKYYYKIRAYKNQTEQKIYSVDSNVVNGVILEKPEIKVNTTRKYIKLIWSRNANATGYVIYRSNKKNGTYKKIKTINKNKTTNYEDKAVEKGKTYHYKIRAYKRVAGKNYYSEYSVAINGKISKIK